MPLSSTYQITYWDDCDGSPASKESNEFPKLTSARRELRERGYRSEGGNAAIGERERWLRHGYNDKPLATVDKVTLPPRQPGRPPSGSPLSMGNSGATA